MDYNEEALRIHKEKKGKLEIATKIKLLNKDDLSVAYTPGVAQVSREIAKNKKEVFNYTIKQNSVAVVTDGSAVLGLGNIGPEAALPVMEGKALLFKEFANIDAYPICLDTQDTEEIINIVKKISPGFGGINLEDISAPRCFEIEDRLIKELNIPVFHDDQHGTAIVTIAALLNALKITERDIKDTKVVIAGAGAAGISVLKMLLNFGVKPDNINITDSKGAMFLCRDHLNKVKKEVVKVLNFKCEEGDEFNPKLEKCKLCQRGQLKDAIKGKDVFIGVSKANIVTEDMVKSMNPNPIIFAMSNPDPEIMPDKAKKAGAKIIATGRSDFPNQINNVLAFPGIFRGALDANATKINDEMKKAAVIALANYIKPTENQILPSPLDKNVASKIAEAVKKAAIKTNVVRN